MKNVLRVAVLTVLTTAFYAYVGHMVPQKITYPPESVELRSDMTTDEMVEAGQATMAGKGICLTCHTIGSRKPGRFPDLGGIGAIAGSRREGMSAVDYLAESLYEPNAYIVEGFNAGMIAVSKPPISLSDQEILSVIAYLQSLGSTPTVTMQTKLKYSRGETEPAVAAAVDPTSLDASAVSAAGTGSATGQELLEKYLCITCHNIDAPSALVGPSLYDVGTRLTTAAIYEAIMAPDETIAEGYFPGVMPAMMQSSGFYDQVSAHQLQTLVDYLASRKGNE